MLVSTDKLLESIDTEKISKMKIKNYIEALIIKEIKDYLDNNLIISE